MPPRNKRPDLNGLLVIDKPLGWTSAHVCRVVRRKTGGAKVGHAGTLDPLATGVLVVCLGRATKLVPTLMATTKAYHAGVDLSAFTSTDDAEGERTEVAVETAPSLERIREVLDRSFAGEIEQRPPAFSAVKIGGERSYRLARRSERSSAEAPAPLPEPAPKRVTILSIEIEAFVWPRLDLRIECSKGTYIRSIARDLGAALGTGGTLVSLVRTRVGDFTLEHAINPDAIPDPVSPGFLIQA